MCIVRLCFEVTIQNRSTGELIALEPICSGPIFNPRVKRDLLISQLSSNEAPMKGGKKIIILGEGITNKETRVRFYDDNGNEDFGALCQKGYHKGCAVSVKTPSWGCHDAKEPGVQQAWLMLVRNDGSTSEPCKFYFTPDTKIKMEMDRMDTNPQVMLEHNLTF